MVRNILCATVIIAVWSVSAATVWGQFGNGNSANNLFSQYYTQPGASLTQAGMYNAPHWVPSYVGHSYYTYQPLMPHEMMYQHSRNYYNYYNTGGYYGSPDALNITTVRWQSGSNHMGPLPFSSNLMQWAKWRHYSNRYCLGGGCGGNAGLLGGLSGLGGRLQGAVHGLHGGCQGGACEGGYSDGGYSDGGYSDGGYIEGGYSGDYQYQDSGCQSGGCLSQRPSDKLQR